MRLRLFWKILFSFWLTFICIVEGVWIIFSLNDAPKQRPWESQLEQSVAETQLNSAATVLKISGREGLEELLSSWPEQEKIRLSYVALPASMTKQDFSLQIGPITFEGIPSEGPPTYSRLAVLPDGSHIRLSYNAAQFIPRPRPGPFNFPLELPFLAVLGGLLFSSLLAWYLTAPVWRLRMGFEHLAEGKLDVRLKHLIGRRRDEIADLAGDFDLMAEQMQSLVKSREQLLHDVSHELRSPLARMHMAIGLARQSPDRTPALLDRIEQESSRMDELVGKLLTLSRVESGENRFDEYFDLLELIQVIVNNSTFEAEQAGVKIKLSKPSIENQEPDCTIRGDAELIRRALENVIRNAIRHSPQGTVVEVSVTADHSSKNSIIKITDQGSGVPQESLNEIFEPFVRLEKNKSHGTGLGLSIAKRAIKAHGGKIKAENIATGGLAVTIMLLSEHPEDTF